MITGESDHWAWWKTDWWLKLTDVKTYIFQEDVWLRVKLLLNKTGKINKTSWQ